MCVGKCLHVAGNEFLIIKCFVFGPETSKEITARRKNTAKHQLIPGEVQTKLFQ
jgi:hypothetical protein